MKYSLRQLEESSTSFDTFVDLLRWNASLSVSLEGSSRTSVIPNFLPAQNLSESQETSNLFFFQNRFSTEAADLKQEKRHLGFHPNSHKFLEEVFFSSRRVYGPSLTELSILFIRSKELWAIVGSVFSMASGHSVVVPTDASAPHVSNLVGLLDPPTHSDLTLEILLNFAQGVVRARYFTNEVTGCWHRMQFLGLNLPVTVMHSLAWKELDMCPTLPLPLNCLSIMNDDFTLKVQSGAVYFDLDGTIVHDSTLIIPTITFLEKCLSRNLEVNLITRNPGELDMIFESAGLDFSIFAKVTQLLDREPKSKFIEEAALFIDNEFLERREVFRSKGIPAVSVEQLNFIEL